MSKKKLNITISSGSPLVGGIVQGDKAKLTTKVTNEPGPTQENWQIFLSQLNKAAEVSPEEVEELRKKVEELYKEKQEPNFIEKSGQVLELLFKAYGWAVSPLRNLFDS
ncbi:MAG: hypothetical protein AAF429_08680 [Pseudomonadota bacterium]